MPNYRVTEKRTIVYCYFIEAKDADEALEIAQAGEGHLPEYDETESIEWIVEIEKNDLDYEEVFRHSI